MAIVRQGRVIAAAALASALCTPVASRAVSPALIDPRTLEGSWTLTGPDAGSCRLVLKVAPAADGQGLALELGDCAMLGEPVASASNWRASSDGFALAAADRATLLFFSPADEGVFSARARDGREYLLRRSR